MTYFGFLIRFLVIPIILLAVLSLMSAPHSKITQGFRNGWQFWVNLSLLGLLAFAYTTPWDNYLVARNIWKYNPGLVSGLFWGWVPVEEYVFFILETALTGLWWRWLTTRVIPSVDFKPSNLIRYAALAGSGLLWLGSVAVLISGWLQGTYLALILAWGLPVVAVQMAFGADILWHYRRLITATVMPIVLYLSTVDSLVIQSGTWQISLLTSTGIFLGKLPLEEAVFFIITALMISFGLTLALASAGRLRWELLSKQLHRPVFPEQSGNDF